MSAGLLFQFVPAFHMVSYDLWRREATALPVFRLIHQNKAETSGLSLQDLLQ